MPTYEYLCPKGHQFEVFQRITAEPGASCPECGEKAERQLSSGAGFLFKGSGFYITDYRSDSYRKAAEQEKPGGAAEPKPSGAEAKSGEKAEAGEKAKSSGGPPSGGPSGASSSDASSSGSSKSSSDRPSGSSLGGGSSSKSGE